MQFSFLTHFIDTTIFYAKEDPFWVLSGHKKQLYITFVGQKILSSKILEKSYKSLNFCLVVIKLAIHG